MRNGLLALAWRFLTARKLRSLASVVSITLGVAFLSALITLNSSMEASVEAYLQERYGAYDIMAGYRTPDTRLSNEDLAVMRQVPGITDVAGVLLPYMLESHAEVAAMKLAYYGVSDTPLSRQFMPIQEGRFPTPGEVAVSEAWAKRQGVGLGDMLEIPVPPNGARSVRVSGFLPTINGLPSGIAMFERSWLEEATGRPGATFTLVAIERGLDITHLTATLRNQFPDMDVDHRKFLDEARKNLNALRPVALGMGLAALLSSAFLLVGAFRLSLTERIRELAMLRAIGAIPAQVKRMLLAEGLLVGALGSGIGALLGAGAAVAGAGAVARLLQTEPVPPVIPWPLLALIALGGALLSVAAALGVARSAGKTEPLLALRPDLSSQERDARRGGWFGIALLVLGVGALATSPFLPEEPDFLSPLTSSTGGLVVGLGLLLGLQRLLHLLLPLFALPWRRTMEGPVAVRSLLRHRRRSGNTVGAMGLALILVTAVLTISGSLLDRWFQQIRVEHPADMKLEVPRVIERGVGPELAQLVAAVPGITEVATIGDSVYGILTDWDWSKADPEWMRSMEAFDSPYMIERGFRQHTTMFFSPATLPELVDMGLYTIAEGGVDDWTETSIALNKRVAKQRGIQVGDTLTLNVHQGGAIAALENPILMQFTVVAILEDTLQHQAMVYVGGALPGTEPLLRSVYANTTPEQLASARAAVQELVKNRAYNMAEYSDYEIASAELRSQINQRFALLLAVAAVMAAVATMSLINTMISSVAERRREFAMLRAIGATPEQLRKQILLEAGLLGMTGGLVGVAGGAILGASALTGLGMDFATVQFPWLVMTLGILASASLACLAAMVPARGALRLPPAVAVRVE